MIGNLSLRPWNYIVQIARVSQLDRWSYLHVILHVFHVIVWQVVKVFILSRLKIEGALIKQAQEGVNPVEKNAAENLKNLLLVHHIII